MICGENTDAAPVWIVTVVFLTFPDASSQPGGKSKQFAFRF